jgi:hypothetical protein
MLEKYFSDFFTGQEVPYKRSRKSHINGQENPHKMSEGFAQVVRRIHTRNQENPHKWSGRSKQVYRKIQIISGHEGPNTSK